MFAVAFAEDLDLPAALFGVSQVHAQQVAGEDRGFVATGAGADLEEQIALVARVARQQEQVQLLVELGFAGLEACNLLGRQLAELGVVEHGPCRGQRACVRIELGQGLGQGPQVCMLAGHFAQTIGVAEHLLAREQAFEFLVAFGQLFELATDRGGHGFPGPSGLAAARMIRDAGENPAPAIARRCG